MPPRKHIVSARIKPPNEGRGFCNHFCRALKRTFVYMVFVAIISAVLYFTDGLWQCAAPYTLTPVDLSSLQKKAKVNDPKEGGVLNSEEGYELMFVDHLFEGLVSGPESFEFYQDSIITSNADGRVLMLREKSNSSKTLYSRCEKFTNETECGRPLGLKIVDERKLLIVDSYHGLVEVGLQSQTQKDLLKTGSRSPYKFLNAVAVDDTSIYLTHSSSRHQRQEFPKIGLELDCSGSLLKLDRKSLELSVLASSLCFPNGVELDNKSPAHVLVAETLKARVIKVDKKSGELTVFADGLPGLPDNMRKGGEKGGYWIGLPTTRMSGYFDLMFERPFVRTVLRWLHAMELLNPLNLVPGYGLVIHVDDSGKLTRVLRDPTGHGSQKVSEAAYHKGYLYLGSYHPRFQWIARYNLDKV